MAKTGVIGAGSWGTALALVLHNNGHEVTLWSHSKSLGGESFREPGTGKESFRA